MEAAAYCNNQARHNQKHNMTKYERLKMELELHGTGNMKCFGQSMMPILKSGSLLTFRKQESYAIKDIVFCKVKGRYIDAHKIVKTDPNKGYLIANNHGYENGWTRVIYGKAIACEYKGQTETLI
jgi:SOS-response transcriptional repressor LexA